MAIIMLKVNRVINKSIFNMAIIMLKVNRANNYNDTLL